MGRMLDALRQPLLADSSQSQESSQEDHPSDLHAIWPDEPGQSDKQDKQRSRPYIEVGGKEVLMSSELMSQSKSSKIDQSWMSVRFHALPTRRDQAHGLAKFAPELIAFHDPDHPISLEYRELTSTLLLHLPVEEAKVLMFTSTGRGSGTTTVMLNSALTCAQHGNREVIVVDCHLRHSALAERLGLPPSPGLAEVLDSRIPLADVIQQTGVPHLKALTAGCGDAIPQTSMMGELMRDVLRELRKQSDLILIDAPHWNGHPDIVALGSLCDAVYLCLPEKQQSTAQEAIEVLSEQGVKLRGCILTSR